MLEQAAHEEVGRLAEVGVAVVVGEDGLAVFHQQHMDVHPAACLAVHRLGHQGGALAVFQGGVVDDIFDHHGGVGHFGHLTQLRLDLELAGGPHLGVVVLDGDAGGLHVHAHFAAALIGAVEGLGHVVVGLAGDNYRRGGIQTWEGSAWCRRHRCPACTVRRPGRCSWGTGPGGGSPGSR